MLRNLLVIMVFSTAAVIGVWDLLQLQAFDNAIIQFATAGVVPGTGVVLSPGQVYIAMGGVLLLAIFLLFHKAILRDFRDFRRSFSRRTEPAMQPVIAEPVAVPKPVVAAPIAALEPAPAPQPSTRPVVVITVPGAPGLLATWFHSFKVWYKPATARAWHYTVIRSRQDTRQLQTLAVRYARLARKGAVHAWRYAEPRIREYDTRIEQAVKRNPTVARALREADRQLAYVRSRVGDWRAKTQRPVEK